MTILAAAASIALASLSSASSRASVESVESPILATPAQPPARANIRTWRTLDPAADPLSVALHPRGRTWRDPAFDDLTPADMAALCEHFNLPTPTPDVSLSQIFSARGLTAADVWTELAHTTSIRLMIAAAALRGTTHLPPDPQLRPAPHAPCGPPRAPLRSGEPIPYPNGSPVLEASRKGSRKGLPARPLTTRGSLAFPDDYVIQLLVTENPKRRGTGAWDRFALWRTGATVREMREAGLRREDFVWDSERNYIKIEPAS